MDRLDLLGPFLAPPQNPRNHVMARNPHLRSLNSQVCIFWRKTLQVCIVGEIETVRAVLAGRTAAGRVVSGLLGFVASEPAGEQAEWKLVSIVYLYYQFFALCFTCSPFTSSHTPERTSHPFCPLEKGTLAKRKKKLISSSHRHNSVKTVFLELREVKKNR